MLNNLDELKSYTPAKVCSGKSTEIVFYAFNPEKNKLDRKRIRLNHIKKVSERKKYANELLKKINQQLIEGWNPFIDPEKRDSYKLLSEAIAHFHKISEKKLNDKVIREETYKDYISYLRNFEGWIEERYSAKFYVYKLDKRIIGDFLEYIYVERNRTAQTRNNYLNLLRVFAGFLVEKDYLKNKVTDGINNLRKAPKQRTVIKKKDIKKLNDFLIKENQLHYLFACQILYFTFIRPKEMARLQIGDINFAKKTIFIPDEKSKNKKAAVVTIPNSLGQLMIDLKIHEYPSDFYIFSKKFRPGEKHCSEKQFRDYWLKIREALKFPKSYQFYSLKDTGITELITKTGDPLLVRDQARHSSISITNIYTPKILQEANKKISEINMIFGD